MAQGDDHNSRMQAWSIDDPTFSGQWGKVATKRTVRTKSNPLLPAHAIDWEGMWNYWKAYEKDKTYATPP